MNNNLSNYLSGITNLSSSISTWIGPSFIETYCFNKNNYQEELLKYFELPKINIELNIKNQSLTDLLTNIYGDDKKLIESIIYWFSFTLGKEINIYELSNNTLIEKLSRENGGISPFYFVEDIFFLEYEKYMLVLVIGNNE